MNKRLSVKDISFEILGSLTDFIIWYTAFFTSSFGKTGSRGVYKAAYEADEFLSQVNHNTIAVTWHNLFKKKLLTYKTRGNLYSPTVTEFGYKRIKSQIPIYYEKRPWDGKIYLITYDIPEVKTIKRALLRSFLRKIGAASLQESVWLTPYNPREILNEFVKLNGIDASIIVSDIGKDGGVGETSIQDVLVKIFKLEKINDRYEQFVKKAKTKSSLSPYLTLEYLSILRDDPQLPFELLPNKWLGNEAYKMYLSLLPKSLS